MAEAQFNSTAKALREERAGIAEKMRALAAKAQEEGRKFTPEEREQFDAMHTDSELKREQADHLETVEQVEAEMRAPVGAPGEFRLAGGVVTDRKPADSDKIITRRDVDNSIRAWGLREDATREQLEAAAKVGMDVHSKSLRVDLVDTPTLQRMRRDFRDHGIHYRATGPQSKGTNAKGGFTVPTELANTIEEAMLFTGGLRSVATILRTAGGHDLNIPTADDTTQVATVLAENTAATGKDITFAQVTLRAAKYTSGLVRASIELLQDTGVDLVGFIGSAIGTRMVRGTNRDYTTGSTATTSPRGIIRDSFEGFAATTTSGDISLTTMTEIKYSVDDAYTENASWMMHKNIVREWEQVVDSQGRPIWRVGLAAGQPDTLGGFPIIRNERMVSSTTGAGQKLLTFGDHSKYLIRDVMGVDIIRFDERFMDSLQVAWLGVLRTDGKLLLASTRNASKPVAHLKGTT